MTAELPQLNEGACSGCGDCVAVCPVDCMAMAGTLPWLPRPADCIACDLCAIVCPTDAIKLGPLAPA